jgi:hypothetical protein
VLKIFGVGVWDLILGRSQEFHKQRTHSTLPKQPLRQKIFGVCFTKSRYGKNKTYVKKQFKE